MCERMNQQQHQTYQHTCQSFDNNINNNLPIHHSYESHANGYENIACINC